MILFQRNKDCVLLLIIFSLIAFTSSLASAGASAGEAAGAEKFLGKIEKAYEESVESWPEKPSSPEGAPNIVVIMLDDVGYSQIGAYGGIIETPNIDRLANNGLRYTNFQSTALCTPSRASILAGRNHHKIGMGGHALTAMGFPGYNSQIPDSAQSVATQLGTEGYINYALGKWDAAPPYEVSIVGPFDQWPSGQGFQHYYGFMAAEVDNFTPVLWEDHSRITLSKDPNYHLSTDLADKAINYITAHESVASDTPFFVYWAPAGMHAPLQAPQSYLDYYKGRYDKGWDNAREVIFENQKKLSLLPEGTKLTERTSTIPAWDSLSKQERKLYARQMEAFAAMLTHLDNEVGRIVSTLERTGVLDNTLIIITSDNGASAEGGLGGTHNEAHTENGTHPEFEENMAHYENWGGPTTFPHYHAGWAWAGNAPFKYFKQSTHNGGIQVPFIVSWPENIKKPGIRTQYHHIIDVMPTLLDAANVEFKDVLNGVPQMAMDGVSMMYSFNDESTKSKRNEQYFEMWGNRAIYKDGWKAVTLHGEKMPWQMNRKISFDNDKWELYHIAGDFSESNDLSEEMPSKLEELTQRWETLAWENNVYPLYDDITKRIAGQQDRLYKDKKVFTYFYPGAINIAEQGAAPIKGKSHRISTTLDLTGGEEGVLVAAGGFIGGYTLFIKNHQVIYEYNSYNTDRHILRSSTLPKGKVDIKFEMKQINANEGVGSLYVNGKKVDEMHMKDLMPAIYSLTETFDVGKDTGSHVSNDYGEDGDFSYKGVLDKVIITLLD